ncbi:hypothetical protein [Rhodococcus koreensis]
MAFAEANGWIVGERTWCPMCAAATPAAAQPQSLIHRRCPWNTGVDAEL